MNLSDLVLVDSARLELVGLAVFHLLLAAGAGLVLHRLVFFALLRVLRPDSGTMAAALAAAARPASRLLFPALVVLFALPVTTVFTESALVFTVHSAGVLAIVAVTWLLCSLVDAAADTALSRLDVGADDNLQARRVHTQVSVLERTLIAVIVVIGCAAVLMTFPRVREIGASLLVSAGFAGLAIGLAARPVLENLIGGLQLAFTQPIRIDDVVIVEGEWGWIEEMTATYVVVRIWDQRRLIVPLSRFITQPFQNWTRTSAEILGTVFLHVDYTVPVPAVRAELERLCRDEPLWDGRVCVLQVTDARERTLELRALVSASSSPQAWDLRVKLREKLIEFLQREHPESLPRLRVDMGEDLAARTARP